jgi:hypothetical protein
LVPIVDLVLPCLEDAIDGLWGCISLEELRFIEGLGQHVPNGVEGGNELALPGIGDLEGGSYVAQLVTEGHLTKDRLVYDSGEDSLDALASHDFVAILSRLILSY